MSILKKIIIGFLVLTVICAVFGGSGNDEDSQETSIQDEIIQEVEDEEAVPEEEVEVVDTAEDASETAEAENDEEVEVVDTAEDTSETAEAENDEEDKTLISSETTTSQTTTTSSSGSSGSSTTKISTSTASFDITSIPEYSGSAYVTVNGNVPYFTADELTTTSFETYSSLDSLGRCGVAYACVGEDIMPTESRGSIGSVKPTGWHSVKYDIVSGSYLYNRCHLIAYELAGENANEKNLITGTRYLNINGMLPFENMVADYVKETGNHVLYRVTPIFEGDNLLASGVLMEAMSVEDEGEDILFCVYCYNVQPGIGIDYATGDSWLEDDSSSSSSSSTSSSSSSGSSSSSSSSSSSGSGSSSSSNSSSSSSTSTSTESSSSSSSSSSETSASITYILNTNTKKFHRSSCSSVKKMADKNKAEYTGTRDEVIAMGYEACKNCNP